MNASHERQREISRTAVWILFVALALLIWLRKEAGGQLLLNVASTTALKTVLSARSSALQPQAIYSLAASRGSERAVLGAGWLAVLTGDDAVALTYLERFRSEYRADPIAAYFAAIAYRRAGDLDAAVDALFTARVTRVLLEWGLEASSNADELETGQTILERLANLPYSEGGEPVYSSQVYLVDMARNRGDCDAAVRWLSSVWAVHQRGKAPLSEPEKFFTQSAFNLGECYSLRGQDQKAAEQFRWCVRVLPDYANISRAAYVRLSEIALRASRYAEAVDWIETGLQWYPEDPNLLERLNRLKGQD